MKDNEKQKTCEVAIKSVCRLKPNKGLKKQGVLYYVKCCYYLRWNHGVVTTGFSGFIFTVAKEDYLKWGKKIYSFQCEKKNLNYIGKPSCKRRCVSIWNEPYEINKMLADRHSVEV